MKRLAIVGTGIAGLGCAYFLQNRFELTLFEQAAYTGGHTNTVEVLENGQPVGIDTGFMVYNETTYPNLTRLFQELAVPVKNTDMSFSVQHQPDGIEWCGSGYNHLFAQRKNLLSPRYWKMLLNLNRFCEDAELAIAAGDANTQSIAEYVALGNYGDDFLNWFLIPMSSAIWSTAPDRMLQFPARTLLQFFKNHGFLGMKNHLQWKTVCGGAQEYVKRMVRPFADQIHHNQPVRVITRNDKGVTINLADGSQQEFDHVILACHADQALRLLSNPTGQETDVLSRFHYESNQALLHTDVSVMPKRKLCWASWNYQVTRDSQAQRLQAATHYWMNSLQGVSDTTHYFVSINAGGLVNPDRVIREITYEHPLFSLPVIEAQQKALPALNQQAPNQAIYFCGSYFKYGFHEDAFTSALELCQTITGIPLWQH